MTTNEVGSNSLVQMVADGIYVERIIFEQLEDMKDLATIRSELFWGEPEFQPYWQKALAHMSRREFAHAEEVLAQIQITPNISECHEKIFCSPLSLTPEPPLIIATNNVEVPEGYFEVRLFVSKKHCTITDLMAHAKSLGHDLPARDGLRYSLIDYKEAHQHFIQMRNQSIDTIYEYVKTKINDYDSIDFKTLKSKLENILPKLTDLLFSQTSIKTNSAR